MLLLLRLMKNLMTILTLGTETSVCLEEFLRGGQEVPGPFPLGDLIPLPAQYQASIKEEAI